MKALEQIVRESMEAVFTVKAARDGARVVTHNMYPSNSFVQIMVRGGEREFYVSDMGGALMDVELAGAEISRPDKVLRDHVVHYGLEVKDGVIRSPFIPASALAVYIAVVSKASQECAEFLYKHARIKRDRNLKKMVAQFLSVTFEDKVKHKECIVGASNKPHRFDNVVVLESGKRLIVDPVIHEPASINARVVANMDVAAAKHPNIEQRIVYDDNEEWKVEDLNLLQAGATVVPFSKSMDVIRRIAAA